MIEGIIIRGVGGNYYVDIGDKMIECRARGLFRLKNIKPLVGDRVLIRITEEDEDAGYIEEIIDRKSEIKRPNIANAQQLIIIFSVKNPEPSFLLMDKLLIAASSNKLDPVICINKSDLADEGEKDKILEIFKNTGYKIIFTSKYDKDSLSDLKEILKDKLNVFSGPSGVGKSSLMNAIEPGFHLETGEISEKLKRGRHTTRHAEIFKLSFGGYAVDTPGFSSFELEGIDIASRIGGEEFAVILINADAKIGKAVADKLRNSIEKEIITIGEQEINITVSIGITSIEKGIDSYEEVYKYADKALYISKAKGKNQVNTKFKQL
jgi:ribosome biogenesis GTPase